jgi:hypothetical protein
VFFEAKGKQGSSLRVKEACKITLCQQAQDWTACILELLYVPDD